jgi:hypothetical protein
MTHNAMEGSRQRRIPQIVTMLHGRERAHSPVAGHHADLREAVHGREGA